MRIQQLEFGEGEVAAIIEEKSERTFTENGQLRRLDVTALQRETWEQAGNPSYRGQPADQ